MEKRLSIIIPTYNMEKYLRYCLDSLIIKENMDKLEVLVINDGSKDTSSAIAHEYQDKYPQTFRVIDKENGNYGSCINRGLKAATGKYVKVLDADDSFDTEAFQYYMNTLLGLDVDLVLNDFITVDENRTDIKEYKSDFQSESILSFTDIESFVLTNYMAMHRVAYRTSLLRELKYVQTEGISYTDQEWIFIPMTKVKSIYYIPSLLYRYLTCRQGQTMSSTNFAKSVKPHITILYKMIEQYQAQDNKYKKYLYSRMLFLAKLVYEYSLLGTDESVLTELNDIDIIIKERIPELYKSLNRVSVKKFYCIFPYVLLWRCQRNRLAFSSVNKLFKLINL